jgi:hypothetical protein
MDMQGLQVLVLNMGHRASNLIVYCISFNILNLHSIRYFAFITIKVITYHVRMLSHYELNFVILRQILEYIP